MNRIYFVPGSQTENTGDLLINKVAIQLVGKYGQVILDDSDTDDWFLKELKGVNDLVLSEVTKGSLDIHLFRSLVKSLFSKDNIYLLLPPGHASRLERKAAYSVIKKSVWFLFLKMLGLRLIRIGFSIGPFDKSNAVAESFHSRAYYFYGIRDSESMRIAEEAKIKKPHLFPDLAWSYHPPVTASDTEKGRYIILSFRSNTYGTIHDKSYLVPYIKRIRDILSSFADLNLKIVISYQVKYDREASFMLKDALANDFDVEVIDKKLLLDEASRLYSEAYFILSNRLHVLLFALQCDTVSFPLIDEIDNMKIFNIWKDNQMNDSILDINANATENIIRVRKGIENNDFVLAPFVKARKKNEILTEQYLASIFK